MNKGTGDTAFIIALVSYLCAKLATSKIDVMIYGASAAVWGIVAFARWWNER